MKYNGVIQRKLALLNNQLLHIESALNDVFYGNFESSWQLRSMTERALQVAIEIVIDISERIISIENCGPAESASDTIKKLVALKVLDSVQPYEKMVRFRNVIVHQYEYIDPAVLFDLAKNRLNDFREFIKAIDKTGNNQ